MLRLIKKQTLRALDATALLFAGIGLSSIAFLGAAIISVGALIALPYSSARVMWQSILSNEPTAKRALLSGLAGLGVFVGYAVTFPFVVAGLVVSSVFWPMAGAYLSVTEGWSGVDSASEFMRDLLFHVQVMILEPEQFMLTPGRGQLNDAQSAHQKSIEVGVKRIVLSWKEKYSSLDENAVLAEIKSLRNRWLQNNVQDIKHKAAIRFLTRVINNREHMLIKREDVTLRSIVLWAFHHMQQSENWLSGVTQEGIELNLIECLCNIQRGYNLDENGTDLGGRDHVTCFGGTINKLVYGMAPVLKEININYMSYATALKKLQALATYEIKQYMNAHVNELGDFESIAFDDLLEHEQEESKERIKHDFLKDFSDMPDRAKILSEFVEHALPYAAISRPA